MKNNKKQATLIDALIPIAVLIGMLVASYRLYGSDSSYGANQIALILAAAVGSLVGFKNGYTWAEIEKGIVKGISSALGAILILLMVGSLIGTWIMSGTVPTMIYLGLKVLDPSIFYVATCIICAMVSISIGSSWTTAGTVGIALIGIATALDLSLAITAGAIISGAYFGDKMSPLSDTTNLAPAVSGTDLFTHIRHMAWTTGPSILLAIIIFAIIGFASDSSGVEVDLGSTISILENQFNLSLWSLVPLLVVLFMAFKKVPAFLTLLSGAILGGLFALFLQPMVLQNTVADSRFSCELHSDSRLFTSCRVSGLIEGSKQTVAKIEVTGSEGQTSTVNQPLIDPYQSFESQTEIDNTSMNIVVEARGKLSMMLDAIWRGFFAGYKSNTGNEAVDSLLSRGGMESMLNTVWLILCAMTFGAVLETIGLLQRVVRSILSLVSGTGSLITSVVATCVGTNIIAGDQYIAIVLPGRMFRAEFKKRGLDPKNLSRTLEDSATMTSPLIPWNTCGAYMSATLGVPTFVYLPFCFFNLTSPFVSIIYGITHFKIARIDKEESNDEDELATN